MQASTAYLTRPRRLALACRSARRPEVAALRGGADASRGRAAVETAHWTADLMARARGTSAQRGPAHLGRRTGFTRPLSAIQALDDPNLVDKLRDVVGLYVDPPAHADRAFADEKLASRCCRGWRRRTQRTSQPTRSALGLPEVCGCRARRNTPRGWAWSFDLTQQNLARRGVLSWNQAAVPAICRGPMPSEERSSSSHVLRRRTPRSALSSTLFAGTVDESS